MANDQLFIADKIRVGQVKRSDTYTGRLGYVIYYDKAGKLRKETSWQNWRDKSIEPLEFDNAPTEGFVLNRNGGGRGSGHGYNDRHTFVRVWDPRGFEFEVDIPNLLFILKEAECRKGKGLEGAFVYAWDNNKLTLLPTCSHEYQQSIRHTDLQGRRLKGSELTPGYTYRTKDGRDLVYVGKFDQWGIHSEEKKAKKKRLFIFHNGKNIEERSNVDHLAMAVDESIHPRFSDRVEEYLSRSDASPVVRLFLQKEDVRQRCGEKLNRWFFEASYGVFEEMGQPEKDAPNACPSYGKVKIVKGCLHHSSNWSWDIKGYRSKDRRMPNRYNGWGYSSRYVEIAGPWVEPTEDRLYAELANGKIYQVQGGNFYDV